MVQAIVCHRQSPASRLRGALRLAPIVLAIPAFAQTLTTLYSFGGVPGDGQAPPSGVVMDRRGHLFGTTGTGGSPASNGTVFELSPPAAAGSPWTETILHRFHGGPDDGKNPISRLVLTSSGTLFGTTAHGNVDDNGSAYSILPGQRENVLYNFGTISGDIVNPSLGFYVAPGGLYAVDSGGANLTGAFYLLTPPAAPGLSWTQHVLFSFGPGVSGDASSPSGELVRDSMGSFYGVTVLGGVNNLGTVYKLSPPAVQGATWTETVLFSFNGTNGSLASGRLLLGGRGQLFGTTGSGGERQAGTVFRLDPPSAPGEPWTHKILYSFTGGSDGGFPENGVIADGTGRLLGTASNSVFMLTPPSAAESPWTETVLHTFSGPDGFTAITPLTLANNSVYGTTSQAGAFGAGTVFQLTLP